MAVTHQRCLHELLSQGIERASSISQKVLVSYTQKIDYIHPATVFSNAQKLQASRMYWSDSSGKIILVGIGSAYNIIKHGNHDFLTVESEWFNLCTNALINESNLVAGTGPLLLGGFSFDPHKQKTALWDSFPDVRFDLPKILLTVQDQTNCYITFNVVVNEHDNDILLLDKMLEKKEILLQDNEYEYADCFNVDFESIEEQSKDQWIDSVKIASEKIKAKKLDKVVLARELKVKNNASFSPLAIMNCLNEEQPLSFKFAFQYEEACFIGASPERLIKKDNDVFTTACIAGSIARGNTLSEDERLGNELLHDEKNLYEHALVVTMIKEAMEFGCEYVHAKDTPTLLKARDIQHLHTPVKGKAKKDVSLLKMVKRLHPTPALGGFPKDKALEMIRELEILDRGWYAAPIGWLDCKGNGEFAVAIRSGLIKGKEASLFAGCGIVGDSNPIDEYKETQMKFRPMLSAIGGHKR